VCDVVDNEMSLHDPLDPYTERVKHAALNLRMDVLDNFAHCAERAVGKLQNGEEVRRPNKECKFVHHSTLRWTKTSS